MKAKKPEIITERLVLKSLSDEDFIDLILIMKDPLVSKTYMVPTLDTAEKERKLFEKLKEICVSDKLTAYGVYFENKIIGFTNSVVIEDKKIEMGYFIKSSLWNNGFATETLKAVIEELFRIGFETVICSHFEENLASGRVMQKSGMKKTDQTESLEYLGKEHRLIYYEINK